MEIEAAPLQLEGYYLREISCSVRPGLEQDAKLAMVAGLHIQPEKIMTPLPYTVSLDVESAKNQKEKNRYRIILKLASDETAEVSSPYIFHLQLVGFFRWEQPPDLPILKTTDVNVARNGAMILYSTAREILAALTSRGPFPGLVLPTYSFSVDDEVAKISLNAVAKAAAKAKTSRPPARKSPTKKH